MGTISNIFLGVNFFNSVINEYIEERRSGKSRHECNITQIKKRITGNQKFPLPDEAIYIIGLYDIVDTVQFLMYFNDRINPSISTIPIRRSGLTRLELLKTLKKNQLNFLNDIPDLRNNFIDNFQEHEQLTQTIAINLGFYLLTS